MLRKSVEDSVLNRAKECLAKLAPQILGALQGPASQEEFDQLVEITGTPLPEGFLRLYGEHNGTDPNQFVNFFYGYTFLGLDECIRQSADYANIENSTVLKNADSGIKTNYVFGACRVPIGDDKGTSLICVDLDPAPGGTFGQVILLDYDSNVALALADSIEKFIEDFSNDLANGRYTLNQEALEAGEHWLETDAEIDLINWYGTQRWAYAKNWI